MAILAATVVGGLVAAPAVMAASADGRDRGLSPSEQDYWRDMGFNDACQPSREASYSGPEGQAYKAGFAAGSDAWDKDEC